MASVTSIAANAFANQTSLIQITIPASVTSIGQYAFKECTALETVSFGNNSQLTSIGYGAFYGCSSLNEITIPSLVTTIGAYAFGYCSSLSEVNIEKLSSSGIISLGANAFYGCSSSLTIFTPNVESGTTYKNANNWSLYADKITISGYIYVTFEVNGGRAIEPQWIASGGNISTSPSRTGYIFDGWYNNAQLAGVAITRIPDDIAQQITLYAKWTLRTYSITYNNLYGASNSNPTTYNVQSPTITLNAPGLRTDCTFDGWYNNPQFTGQAVTQILGGSAGPITLYAKWVLIIPPELGNLPDLSFFEFDDLFEIYEPVSMYESFLLRSTCGGYYLTSASIRGTGGTIYIYDATTDTFVLIYELESFTSQTIYLHANVIYLIDTESPGTGMIGLTLYLMQ